MKALFYEAIKIALGAGREALKYYGLMQKADITFKHDNSPLTQADLASHRFIKAQLTSCSTFKICSEEDILAYNERKDESYYWLIDPLDGTKDFIALGKEWTINIALIHQNRPILGVVYAPCLYELYAALKEEGSFYFESLALKAMLDSIESTESTSFQYIKNLHSSWFDTYKIRSFGARNIASSELIGLDSIFHSTQANKAFMQKYHLKPLLRGSSLKICMLAMGAADIYPRFNGTKEWDTAASDIILEESGGAIIDICTKMPLLYNKAHIDNNHFIAFSKTQLGGDIYKDYFKNL